MSDPTPRKLTAMQHRVLGRLVLGESDRQIAAALALSPWTVHRHLTSLYRRLPLDVSGNHRVGAVRWYLRHAPVRGRGVADHALWLSLTAQQRAVLACLAAGHTDEGIAHELGLALPTVKNHLNAIYRVVPHDVGSSKRVTAVVWYLREEYAQHEAEVGLLPTDRARPAPIEPERVRKLRNVSTGPDDATPVRPRRGSGARSEG